MSTYTPEQLAEILTLHKVWMNNSKEGKRADLCRADLSGANLCRADLCGADLSGADLCRADLCRAYLCGADLCGANLRGADLRGADLSWAIIKYTIGNMQQIYSLQFDTWMVVYTDTMLAIGCQQHSITQWAAFDDEKIAQMDGNALPWWKKWRPILAQFPQLKKLGETESAP